jgi:hypothetical protein
VWGDVVITCYHVNLGASGRVTNVFLWCPLTICVITGYHVNLGAVAKEVNRIERLNPGAKTAAETVPIFRICFHVGFLQPGGQMQRLKKQDLDFACDAPVSTSDLEQVVSFDTY